jgi:hypothetical protein
MILYTYVLLQLRFYRNVSDAKYVVSNLIFSIATK